MKEKTILFVMPRLPFPASSGRKTSLYHYCRILSEELGYRLVVAAFLEENDNVIDCPNFIDKLVVLPKPGSLEKIKNIFLKSIVLQRFPLQVSLYISKKAKTILAELVNKEKPDIVIGDMVRTTEYIRNVESYKIADLDDRISLRYKRQLENDINGINPYGAFINSVPNFLKKIMLLRSVKVKVLKNEISLLERYELEIGKDCDKTIFVAKKEADDFNREIGNEKATAVPIGVDISYFNYREKKKNDYTIGFLGALGVAHNENAVKNFIANIFPLVLKKIPNAKFLVIGGGASESLLYLSNDKITFTGRVDDVRDYLARCDVFVCPLRFGSGIKTKNLEAMAMGIPLVTTSIGAENIDAINNQDWLLADDHQEFAEQICNLLIDDNLREKISKNGSKFIIDNFTWDIAKSQFKIMLKDFTIKE